MNILILTGRFGMGHYSVAEAIKQQIEKVNPKSKIMIVDLFDYVFPTLNTSIYGTFNFFVTKCPSIYNYLNKIDEKHSTVPLKKKVTKKIKQMLEEYQADIVVSTFPVCSQYMSSYKRIERDFIPLYTYITDITVHEEWIAPRTNLYFVGAESTRNILISRGVSESKIIVTGIPVRQEFLQKLKAEKSLKKEVLIMGGGLGLISTAEYLEKLAAMPDIHITMITGKNVELFEKIKEEFPMITVVGYTDQVASYMKKADLLITKSGGITTFEAIHSGTPMYVLKPFLTQEIGNAEYIAQCNIGRVVWSKKTDIADDIVELLQNQNLLERMRDNMRHLQREFCHISLAKYYR